MENKSAFNNAQLELRKSEMEFALEATSKYAGDFEHMPDSLNAHANFQELLRLTDRPIAGFHIPTFEEYFDLCKYPITGMDDSYLLTRSYLKHLSLVQLNEMSQLTFNMQLYTSDKSLLRYYEWLTRAMDIELSFRKDELDDVTIKSMVFARVRASLLINLKETEASSSLIKEKIKKRRESIQNLAPIYFRINKSFDETISALSSQYKDILIKDIEDELKRLASDPLPTLEKSA